MRLNKITATPHPTGNRIDLTWVNPDPDQYPGVRVVRREGTYPTSPVKHLFGLGLSFCRAVARAHGGDLRVASEPGRGSIFTATLSPAICE